MKIVDLEMKSLQSPEADDSEYHLYHRGELVGLVIRAGKRYCTALAQLSPSNTIQILKWLEDSTSKTGAKRKILAHFNSEMEAKVKVLSHLNFEAKREI